MKGAHLLPNPKNRKTHNLNSKDGGRNTGKHNPINIDSKRIEAFDPLFGFNPRMQNLNHTF